MNWFFIMCFGAYLTFALLGLANSIKHKNRKVGWLCSYGLIITLVLSVLALIFGWNT